MFEHLFENIIIEHYPLVNVKTVNDSMWSFLSLSKFIFRGASRLRLVPFQVPDGHSSYWPSYWTVRVYRFFPDCRFPLITCSVTT